MWNFLIYILWKTWTGDKDLIFLFLNLVFQDATPEKLAKLNEVEKERIHFLIDVFIAVAVSDAKASC